MNFTREPIIETIITPREGFKLIVRNSKAGNQEEYSVDALEVVSFGHSFFFRSLERPKSFLVPVSDYEVLEVKETRVVLKNAGVEKAIKIGGGREASIKAPRETPNEKTAETQVAEAPNKKTTALAIEQRLDKKRERRRHRRRRGPMEEGKESPDSSSISPAEVVDSPSEPLPQEGGDAVDETKVSSTLFSRLFPPPPSLISETLSIRDKKKDENSSQGNAHSKQIEVEEEVKQKQTDDDEPPSSPHQSPPSASESTWRGDGQDEMLREGIKSATSLSNHFFFPIFFH